MFKWKLFWLILALGAVASFLVSGTVRVMEDRRAHNLFGQQSELLHQALEANIKRCVGELDSLASLYNSSDHVTKDEFESFAQVIVGNNSSIRALEWVPHVPARERKRFETEKFDGETPSVGINEESTTGRIPAGRREHYAPVYYVCPLEKNESALGFDLLSEPRRRQALERAAQSNPPTSVATPPIKLVQEKDKEEQYGFLLVQAIRTKAPPAATSSSKWGHIEGFVVGVFDIPTIVNSSIANHSMEWVACSIRSDEIADPIYEKSLGESDGTYEQVDFTVSVADKNWRVSFSPKVSFIREQRIPQPWLIFSLGLFFTTLAGFAYTISSRNIDKAHHAEKERLAEVCSREAAYRQAHLLEEISRRITKGDSLDEVLDYIYEGFEDIIPYDRMGLALVDNDSQTVRLRWSRSRLSSKEPGPDLLLEFPGSSLAKIAQSGEPRIIGDLDQYSAENPTSDSTQLILRKGMRSNLTCPVIIGEKAAGFVFFSSTQLNIYEEDHLTILKRLAGQLAVIVEVGQLFDTLALEERRSREVLETLLPRDILRRVKNGERRIAQRFPSATVIFVDLVQFSQWSREFDPSELLKLLNGLFQRYDLLARRYGVEKINTQGDGYLAVAGVPNPRKDHVQRAADFALAAREVTNQYRQPNGSKIQSRIGIHVGPLTAGTLGRWGCRYDVWGGTVNLASRMETCGQPDFIQVSDKAAGMLKGGYKLTKRDPIEAKGYGRIQTFWLNGRLESKASTNGGSND